MINNTIKMHEFNCPCCQEKFNIEITESGDIIITPFILPANDTDISNSGYEFGIMKGGENIE